MRRAPRRLGPRALKPKSRKRGPPVPRFAQVSSHEIPPCAQLDPAAATSTRLLDHLVGESSQSPFSIANAIEGHVAPRALQEIRSTPVGRAVLDGFYSFSASASQLDFRERSMRSGMVRA